MIGTNGKGSAPWRLAIAIAVVAVVAVPGTTMSRPAAEVDTSIELPKPRTEGPISVERALAQRRSRRALGRRPLSLAELAQLLWAAQGITAADGRRAAPSAGALYPLEVMVVSGAVAGLASGIYRYEPAGHRLRSTRSGDRRAELAAAAWDQDWLRSAPAVIVVTGIVERTAVKYGRRAERYVQIEVGAVAQNVYLEAEALGLGTVLVGAFDDARVASVVGLARDERPYALLPVGAR